MLYVEPLSAKFVKGQSHEFAAYLSRMDGVTRLSPPTAVEEVMLLPSGKTRLNGYRYTSAGLSQLLTPISSRGFQFLSDVAGADGIIDCDPAEHQLQDAINTFNNLLRSRFNRIATRRLIRNEEEKLLDGLVGPQYAHMENATIFQAMQEAAESAWSPMEFYGAVSYGRMLTIWYRTQAPIFTANIDGQKQDFHAGCYFCNGEATSTSLRGTVVLYFKRGGCLAPFREYGRREAHLGRHFATRATELFKTVFNKRPDSERWRQRTEFVAKRSLKLPQDVEKLAERRTYLAKKLADWCPKWHPQITRDVVRDAIVRGGSDAANRGGIENNYAMNARRTVFDIITAMLRASISLGQRREAIDRLAFDLLIGKHKF